VLASPGTDEVGAGSSGCRAAVLVAVMNTRRDGRRLIRYEAWSLRHPWITALPFGTAVLLLSLSWGVPLAVATPIAAIGSACIGWSGSRGRKRRAIVQRLKSWLAAK
jgi:hypothetical protein